VANLPEPLNNAWSEILPIFANAEVEDKLLAIRMFKKKTERRNWSKCLEFWNWWREKYSGWDVGDGRDVNYLDRDRCGGRRNAQIRSCSCVAASRHHFYCCCCQICAVASVLADHMYSKDNEGNTGVMLSRAAECGQRQYISSGQWSELSSLTSTVCIIQ